MALRGGGQGIIREDLEAVAERGLVTHVNLHRVLLPVELGFRALRNVTLNEDLLLERFAEINCGPDRVFCGVSGFVDVAVGLAVRLQARVEPAVDHWVVGRRVGLDQVRALRIVVAELLLLLLVYAAEVASSLAERGRFKAEGIQALHSLLQEIVLQIQYLLGVLQRLLLAYCALDPIVAA